MMMCCIKEFLVIDAKKVLSARGKIDMEWISGEDYNGH